MIKKQAQGRYYQECSTLSILALHVHNKMYLGNSIKKVCAKQVGHPFCNFILH